MSQNSNILGLDIGEKRIGVAIADEKIRIAISYDTIAMNESSFRQDIATLITTNDVSTVVVGYPRNQSGEATAQTAYVEARLADLQNLDARIVTQDESLTSVMAEERLKAQGGHYEKGDIDAEAACIILQDYLESRT